MDLTNLPESQLRELLNDLGIVTAGLLTRQQLIRRYQAYLTLNDGGAKIIKPATAPPRPISVYPITDMRY